MLLAPEFLWTISEAEPPDAWAAIVAHALEICSAPLSPSNVRGEITRRDRALGAAYLFLASAGWDLWERFENCVAKTSNRLASWWAEPGGKAVLILDGLSLRELPWIVQGATERGYTIHGANAAASELPGDTTIFAQSLGFSQRSALANDGAGNSHMLTGARTESVNLPWHDCAALIDSKPRWVFWHHWPDCAMHELSSAGQGIEVLTAQAAERLLSDDFWKLVERLATGRGLTITSDHGYAASGLFSDAPEGQKQFLREAFAAQRFKAGTGDAGPWVPPIVLPVRNDHGDYLLALGRRKWAVPGGYPTLSHGGLTVLEVLSPFVEITR
jgi:hypothetical protein